MNEIAYYETSFYRNTYAMVTLSHSCLYQCV